MKHYVLLLRKSKIGYNSYVDSHYIKDGAAPDDIPPWPSELPKDIIDVIMWLEAEDYIALNLSLATLKDKDQFLEYGTRHESGLLEIKASQQLFPLTLTEFALNGFGALTIFFFDSEGKGDRHLRYKLVF